MKNITKVVSLMISLVMVLSICFNTTLPVFADNDSENQNIALGKTTTCSGVEKDSTGTETSLTSDKVVDGDRSSAASRWSGLSSRSVSADEVAQQWVQVDLEAVYTLAEIRVYIKGAVEKYDIQVSEDGSNYTTLLTVADGVADKEASHVIPVTEPIGIRYIRFQAHSYIAAGNGIKYSASVYEIEAYENEVENKLISSNCKVTASTYQAGNLPENIVDGSSSTRWAASSSNFPEWITVDLGVEAQISNVAISWFNSATRRSYQYKIEISNDNKTYTLAVDRTNNTQQDTVTDELIGSARYVRITVTGSTFSSGNASLYEFEIYGTKPPVPPDAKDILAGLGAPTVEDGKLVLPESPSDEYTVSLYGCDNDQIISVEDLTVTEPLVDMPVKVLYKVEHISNPDDNAVSKEDIEFTVEGKYSVLASDNAKPNVVPGLREWKGNEGTITLNSGSKIVISDSSLQDTAETIQFYFEDMLNLKVNIATGEPSVGDVYLVSDPSQAVLGTEGYTIVIDDYVTITAPTTLGVLYGGTSITQIMSQYVNKNTLPKGMIRDYPKYQVRAGMIDVGRMYIPLEYLEEITVYMAYFKLNEVQVHINDYWKNSGYQAFRLESEVYPEIVAKDGHYTKDEYRQYQKDMKQYGIDVITEIDTPYHAECFRNVEGAVMLSPGALDIRAESTYTIIENLFDEYLDGEDPVIQSDNFHIGTDEYNTAAQYKELMRKYTDHFINYVNGKGYNTRLWASLGGGDANFGFEGETPVSTDATMNLWAPYWADVEYTFELGYDIINTNGYHLYIVPGANAGYPDRINLATRYDDWSVNNFYSNRYNGNGSGTVQVANPRLVGASFAVWNDMTSFKGGFSDFDIFDRMRNAVMLVSEKTWYGEKTAGQTSDEFLKRTAVVQELAPGVNPGRYVETESPLIASYDFYSFEGDKILDGSSNSFDATLVNGDKKGINNEGISFDGDGYMSLPMDSIGFPYTVTADLYLEELPALGEKLELFSGKDGSLYAINNNGAILIGYSRGEYGIEYEFMFYYDSYEIPMNKWFTLTLTATSTTSPSATAANGAKSDVILYINGVAIGNAYQVTDRVTSGAGNGYRSTTFVLPVERIMDGVKGAINNFKVYNYKMSATEVSDLVGAYGLTNAALNKDATASSVFPDTGRTADKAVDGSHDKLDRWSSKRVGPSVAPHPENEFDPNYNQWLAIDLGDTYKIDTIKIDWEGGCAKSYEIQYSMDGDTYSTLKTVTGTGAGVKTFNDLGDVEAKYVRIYCTQPVNRLWGYNIIEVEVYESYANELLRTIKSAKETLATYDIGDRNGDLDKQFYNDFIAKLDEYTELANSGTLDFDGLFTAKKTIDNYINRIDKNIVFVDKVSLQALVDECSAFKEADYTEKSWTIFTTYLTEAQAALAEDKVTQAQINSAYNLLAVARTMLVPLVNPDVDKTLLQLVVDLAQKAVDGGEVDNAIDSVKADFNEAFNNAKAVLANDDATQAKVDEAYDALSEMLNRLGFIKGDKDALKALHELVSKLDLEDYEAGDLKEVFKVAMAKAAAVLADGDAMQEEVNEAYNALLKAYKAMKKLDRTLLENEIVASEKTKANLDKYVKKGQAEFLEALENAKAVLAKEELTQAEINEALKALATARANLRYKANKDVLESLVKKAESIDLSQYTDESVEVLNRAKRSAELLLDNDSLSVDDQVGIDKAAEAMARAIDGLQPKPTAESPDDKDNNSKNSGNPSNGDDSNKPKSAKTGDETYLLVLTMTALCLSLLVIYKRKKVNK